MLELYLTRHGETEWNKIRRMQGHKDSPLTELGRKQAAWLAERLGNKMFSHIYTSPLGRAKETATIINKTLNTILIEDNRLKEIDLGNWEGMLIEEIKSVYEKENTAFWYDPISFKMEDKEDFQQVSNRGADFLESLIKQHTDGKILVVAHAIILKGMLNYIQGRDVTHYWEDNHLLSTSLTKVTVLDHQYNIIYLGDIMHHKESIENGWFLDE